MRRAVVNGVLLAGHKGPAVEVPFDPAQRWGAESVGLRPGRRGYPVHVRLEGTAFQSAIVSRMRRFFVLVQADVARRAGVVVGDQVRLEIRMADGVERARGPLKANEG